jgi:hypothetical protein
MLTSRARRTVNYKVNATVGTLIEVSAFAGVRSVVGKGYTLSAAHATGNSIFKRGYAILWPRVSLRRITFFVIILKDRDGNPRQRLVCGLFR